MSEKVDSTIEIPEEPSAPQADFAGSMRQLANEAERPARADEAERPARAGEGPAVSKAARAEFLLTIGQMVRPLAIGVETLGQKLTEQGQLLQKIVAAPPSAPDLSPVNATLEGVRQQINKLGSVESANQKLFDALHTELKGYKDSFLFDALQKPFVRDLIALHDDLDTLHGQIQARLKGAPAGGEEAKFLTTLEQNFDNARAGLLETFSRLDVEPQHTEEGEPTDKRVHRVLSFEPATDAAQDGQVARSVRPGFNWRGRSVRPEEIVARKWQAPASSSTPGSEEPAVAEAAPAAAVSSTPEPA